MNSIIIGGLSGYSLPFSKSQGFARYYIISFQKINCFKIPVFSMKCVPVFLRLLFDYNCSFMYLFLINRQNRKLEAVFSKYDFDKDFFIQVIARSHDYRNCKFSS